MTEHSFLRRQRAGVSTRFAEEWPWLGTALVVGCIVSLSYLLTHPYPAYGAGLYLETAETIVENGYRLPNRIPRYTADGVPFAYPPLMFYASAVLLDVSGVDPILLSRVLPAAVTVCYLIPYYFIASELLDARSTAGVATVLLAVSPPVLQWHLSAGGIVRAPAFLFALTGIYFGVRLFRSGTTAWLVPATILFALTILTHPVYTVFFGLSYLVLYAGLDRSLRGLLLGAAVAVGGLALSAPWWLLIFTTHGPSVFFAAAGTHTGLLGGGHRLLDQFVYTLAEGFPVPLFFLAMYGGVFYFIGTRRPLLPAWLFTTAFVIGKERFQFVAGSMVAAVFLVAIARRAVLTVSPADYWHRTTRIVVTVSVLVVVVIGVMYAAGALPAAHHGSASQPQFIDESDRAAMGWVLHNTDSAATFVVLGDAAEWFPLFAERTILVGPWGVEWAGGASYRDQLSAYRDLSTCRSEQCVSQSLAASNVSPAYLYVPKGPYTVRGLNQSGTESLRQSLASSDRYVVVFENDGAVIYRLRSPTTETPQWTSVPNAVDQRQKGEQ